MGKVLYGLGVAALGMVVVFTGLLILICFIKALSLLVASKKKEAPAKEAAPAPAPAPVEETVSDEVPAEVIAAITAAVAAVWDSPNGFTVRRIKRINNAPAWNRAGREEQVYSRY